MKTLNFRELRANEVSVRAARCGDGWAQLLLYEDARTAMDILDETVGQFGWRRVHSRDNANCTIAIYCEELQQWVDKEDVGVESNTEKEKGLSSDSFKRAAVNWGIGRSLYTSPDIFIKIKCESKNGRYQLPAKIKLSVSKYVVVDGIISVLEIVGSDGKTYFTFDDKRSEVVKPVEVVKPESKIDYSCCSTGSASEPKEDYRLFKEPVQDDDYVIDMPKLFPDDDNDDMFADTNMFPEVEKMETEVKVEEPKVEEKKVPENLCAIDSATYGCTKNGTKFVRIIYRTMHGEEEQFQPVTNKYGLASIVKTLKQLEFAPASELDAITMDTVDDLGNIVNKLSEHKQDRYKIDIKINTKNGRDFKNFNLKKI